MTEDPTQRLALSVGKLANATKGLISRVAGIEGKHDNLETRLKALEDRRQDANNGSHQSGDPAN